MAAEPEHVDRLRAVLDARPAITEKKMFGGVFFMLSGNMLCGIGKYGYLFRVGPALEAEALARPGAELARMKDRSMPGFVHVEPATALEEGLESWVDLAAGYVGAMPPKD
jgi:hypothetical protein